MTMYDVWFLAGLKKQLQCSAAEIREAFEIIFLSVELSSPEEFARMLRLDEMYRQTFIYKEETLMSNKRNRVDKLKQSLLLTFNSAYPDFVFI